jgi:two-component system chemotaxis response regulator CheY
MKILFVDDSGVLRRSMVKTAQAAGFKTVEAENGAEALARLRKHGQSLDLVVLDWNMPVMDGYDVLVKIRAQEEYQKLPILMATSDGVEEDVVKAIQAGAAGYLVKPFTPDKLISQIRSILDANKLEPKV